jgi:hypothetical protein|tara:strand:- start:1092 stop:1541 length:450 start_codon:yes stop_codon:yes gene_type:complete
MGNERITILINVKDRWLDNEEYDRYGDLIRWINPDPTVVWNSGCWDKETGQGVMLEMKASRFRDLTGVIVYGGNVEKRGTHKLTILYGNYTRLNAYRSEGVIIERGRKKAVTVKQSRVLPLKRDKLTEAKEGRLSQLAGIKPRIRRKTK